MGAQLETLLQERFGFSSFRPHQKAVCEAAASGADVLLVMPTGAGKSLCYQLPGVARLGTTLVISPLIALMEDQAIKLQKAGFRAERIHAGRDRVSSRQACIDYLSGNLDFLFIAPERLGVPGFLEMLAKRKPSLIAVDEAHCISQWGHDFRPDYRMLGERLPMLRPSPVIAMTATATPKVQDDIVQQLGLLDEKRFTHGFRRSNIGIEIIELKPSERQEAVVSLLKDKKHRPAIVYAPTRKEAEETAKLLKKKFQCEAYHAGLPPEDRESIQTNFLDGKLEVIVATIAFGMGIDKPDVRTVIHTALPGSVEGYYQEIGRAGRDGKMSRAILMYSRADRRTHEFFHNRDYPEPKVLKAIFQALPLPPKSAVPRWVQESEGFDPIVFEKALQKMRIHGGIQVDTEGNISRGFPNYEKRYLAQRDHKLAQLSDMLRFAEASRCRMVRLLDYFGDQDDRHDSCGICDDCSPEQSISSSLLELSKEREEILTQRILSALSDTEEMPTGRLYQTAFEDGAIERREYELLLRSLERSGLITLYEESFEKDGREIHFTRAYLTTKGKNSIRASRPLSSGKTIRVSLSRSDEDSGITGFPKTPAKKKTKRRKKASRNAEAAL